MGFDVAHGQNIIPTGLLCKLEESQWGLCQTVAKRIIRLEKQSGFPVDPCLTGNVRKDVAIIEFFAMALKDLIENARLSPNRSGRKFPIGSKAGKFAAETCAAGRAV
jgi:hypothetical protein